MILNKRFETSIRRLNVFFFHFPHFFSHSVWVFHAGFFFNRVFLDLVTPTQLFKHRSL